MKDKESIGRQNRPGGGVMDEGRAKGVGSDQLKLWGYESVARHYKISDLMH